jgi:hypothetical protein
MPFTPLQTQGELPNYDLKQFSDTGLLVTDCSFTPRVTIKEKEGHSPGASGPNGSYAQILQVQTTRKALDIELKGEIVPDANGAAVGLANVYPGQSVTCAQFAAADGLNIHGFTRDASKLLMVKEVKRETNAEKVPTVTVPMSYYPEIALAA